MNNREQIQDFIKSTGAMPVSNKLKAQLAEKYPNSKIPLDYGVFSESGTLIVGYNKDNLKHQSLELTKQILQRLIERKMQR